MAFHRDSFKMVLIIEDSPTQAIHLQGMLERVGLRCVLASNGQTGLYLAQTLTPDLIILDIDMPRLNGFEVCQQLKTDTETARIPVIMMTRQKGAEMVQQGRDMGVIEYIPKDAFADAVLLETLRVMKIIARPAAA